MPDIAPAEPILQRRLTLQLTPQYRTFFSPLLPTDKRKKGTKCWVNDGKIVPFSHDIVSYCGKRDICGGTAVQGQGKWRYVDEVAKILQPKVHTKVLPNGKQCGGTLYIGGDYSKKGYTTLTCGKENDRRNAKKAKQNSNTSEYSDSD